MIYTNFNDFINEKRDTKSLYKRAKEIIKINQKKGGVFKLPKDFIAFPEVKVFNEEDCMAMRLCYLNAFQVAKDNNELHLAIGLVIDDVIYESAMTNITPHAFNIDDKNRVHDYTIGFLEDEDDTYPEGYIYIGKLVTDKEFEILENSDNPGVELREMLLSKIK